jgi:tetratricopeptide (TPR) repeat protein
MALTPGTKLTVLADDNPGDKQRVLVSLVAIGRIGRVDRGAVIPQADAIAYFTAALEKKSSAAAARLARGKVWFYLGERDKALADLDEGLRLHLDSGALTTRAWIWKQRGNADKALADFDAAIRLNPRDSLAWRVRGATWASKDEYGKALEDFNEALRVDPFNVDALNHRASFAAGSKQPAYRNGKQAVADATRACELTNWKEGRYLGTLAAAYSEQGDFAAALNWIAQAIELTPEGQRKYLTELQKQFENKQPFRRGW